MYATATPPRYVSPPGYAQYEYGTQSRGYSGGTWAYSPQPSKSHTRHASYGPTSYGYANHDQGYYSPPAYNSSGYYRAQYTASKPQDFASSTDRMRAKARGYSVNESSRPRMSSTAQYASSKYEHSSKSRRYFDDDEGYSSGATPPPPYHEPARAYNVDDRHTKSSSSKKPAKSPDKSSSKKEKESKSSRQRANSYSTPKSTPTPQKTSSSTRPRTSSSAKTPAKATEKDAIKAGIPAGYSYKNWDPDEEPILLLGSVFDANSLGKWIYDWTVYRTGPATPMSEVAGELWLLLIQLAGKVKRADACLDRIRRQDKHDLVEDFLESGERIWSRFGRILKICEDYMWKVAKKEAKKKGISSASAVMGPKSGCEFVDSMFGRDRHLEDTEKLMTSMRLWSVRFDANCEDILRRPSA